MVIQWNVTLPELTGDAERRAYLYLPEACRRDPELRLPVLYMFDGHNVFFDSHATYGKSWGMAAYLDRTETPLIVAAVECNHSPDHGRLSEYSPFDFQEAGPGRIKGRGKATMEWMVHTFKPYVDANFPTLPDRAHTFIAGSSMGGLMSLYAVTAYNAVFSRAACLSPSVWCSPGRLDKLLKEAPLGPDTVIYLDYGSRELQNHPGMVQRFSRVTARLMERGACVSARIVPDGEHCEASWEKQIPFFMETLFYGLE